ncbi:HET-domain-containing protein, partial [Lojkania enalia]
MNDALSQPKEELTFSGRLIYSDTLNYALIRHWLSIERSDVEDEQSDSNLETISINLVDIESRVVIRWPRWKPAFVALSYVWGNIGGTARDFQDKHGEEQLPERCSRTIEDAITVTKNLGYRYLWVDLYCMSRDPAVRREQIAQMGVIYKSAPVTIIAPGEDADYGLPGVSRPRNPQIFYQSKDLCMISMQLDPLHDLESSKYSTRGWTYQEKLFAHRSLVFMDDQVFMESPEELYAESFFAPLRWRTQSAPWARDRQLQIHSDLFDEQQYFDKKGGMAQRTNGAFHGPGYIGLFQRHVQQYTRRALSYDSDALNAFQAVLEKF